MPQLAAQLEVRADLDLSALFGTLATDVLGVDLGSATFDPSRLLDVVGGAGAPDLAGLRAVVQGSLSLGGGRLDAGLPGATVPAALTDLVTALSSLPGLVPTPALPEVTGLDGLALRVGSVRASVETGPVADLLGLLPGLRWPDTLGRLGGSLGGGLDLLRVLAGLTAAATVSRTLVERTGRFAALLDGEAATAAGDLLLALSGEVDLVAAVRAADPADAATVDELLGRVAAFADAVGRLGEEWSTGLGYGEAALSFLDVTGAAAMLELARLAVTGTDLASVAALVADVRRAGAPFLDAPLPDPEAFAGGFATQAATLADTLTATVTGWDVAATLHPVTDLADLALRPLTELRTALAGVEAEVTGALHSLRGVVDELDLTPVANALTSLLAPVTTLLDTVGDEIAGAQAQLTAMATGIADALGDVADLVGEAAGTVTGSLGEVAGALDDLHLQDLADALAGALRSVAATLASAQLSPYFDAAIDVISTAADVVEQVPFGMLPTDVQQEIVDACRPIKQLDLQQVEDALRAELAQIRAGFADDALAALEAAYGEVVAFLASLDPTPLLETFEAETLGQVRSALDEVDPTALLAPVDEALAGLRGLLDGLDLEAEVLAPLREVFTPVLDAVDSLDPASLLAPVQAQVDEARRALAGVLHLEDAEEALDEFRARVVGLLDRLDPAGVAEVLDERALTALAALPDGPPGGAFGSLLVSLAEAGGLAADEGAVADVMAWVRGESVAGDDVHARLQGASEQVAEVRRTVAALDPAPVVAAASAHQRGLTEALATHPADSPLRVALEPVLAAAAPGAPLATLAENRRRYLASLDATAAGLVALAAPGRGELTEAAASLRVALGPLGAFPEKLRRLLAAVGLDPAGRTFRQVLLDLAGAAGPAGLTAALTGLVEAARAKLVEVVDVVVGSGRASIDAVQGLLALLDLAPVVAELTGLQHQVHEEIAQLSPDALLGPPVAAAGQVVERLRTFDPLAPVRQVVDAALAAADAVFESARPTVVFAPVVDLHHRVVGVAAGLDVVALLRPILDALDGLAGQLDSGFDRTGDALHDLQDALPSEVSDSPLSLAASVDLGVSF